MRRNCVHSCRIYTARLSPALNGSSEIRHFECSDAIEIRNGIIFDFYTGLTHMRQSHFTSENFPIFGMLLSITINVVRALSERMSCVKTSTISTGILGEAKHSSRKTDTKDRALECWVGGS